MAYQIPIYLFTGFLESGKTHMIQESMENPNFNQGNPKTLIIQCEEGIEELDATQFDSANCVLEIIENEADLGGNTLKNLTKKHKPDRIIVEYNGMWQLKNLYENMPESWAIFQQIMFVQASTFFVYNQNMRQLMVDKMLDAEMVVLTRTTPDMDKEQVHKIVRGVSRSARIAYDYPDGHFEYDEIEDPLPFDINAPVIDIKDEDFAIWYRDLTEEMDVYEGKTVHVKGMVARNTGLPQNAVVIGRHIMTCCADDIAYSGLVCNFPMPSKVSLKTRDWIYVTAKIKLEKHKLYNGNVGPVLYAANFETADEPKEVVATFY